MPTSIWVNDLKDEIYNYICKSGKGKKYTICLAKGQKIEIPIFGINGKPIKKITYRENNEIEFCFCNSKIERISIGNVYALRIKCNKNTNENTNEKRFIKLSNIAQTIDSPRKQRNKNSNEFPSGMLEAEYTPKYMKKGADSLRLGIIYNNRKFTKYTNFEISANSKYIDLYKKGMFICNGNKSQDCIAMIDDIIQNHRTVTIKNVCTKAKEIKIKDINFSNASNILNDYFCHKSVNKNDKYMTGQYLKCELSDNEGIVYINARLFKIKDISMTEGDIYELVYTFILYKLFLHSKENVVFDNNWKIKENASCFQDNNFKPAFEKFLDKINECRNSGSEIYKCTRIDCNGCEDKVNLHMKIKAKETDIDNLKLTYCYRNIASMKNSVIKTLNNRPIILNIAKATYCDNFPSTINCISTGSIDGETLKMDLILHVIYNDNGVTKRVPFPISLKNKNTDQLAQKGIASLLKDSPKQDDIELGKCRIRLFLYLFFGIDGKTSKEWVNAAISKGGKQAFDEIKSIFFKKEFADYIRCHPLRFTEGIKRAYTGTANALVLKSLNSEKTLVLPGNMQECQKEYESEMNKLQKYKELICSLNLPNIIKKDLLDTNDILKHTLYDKEGTGNHISTEDIDKILKIIIAGNKAKYKDNIVIFNDGTSTITIYGGGTGKPRKYDKGTFVDYESSNNYVHSGEEIKNEPYEGRKQLIKIRIRTDKDKKSLYVESGNFLSKH